MPHLASKGEPVLDIRNLSIGFPGRPVVEDVNLSTGQGEIVAIIGESGSGKTLVALSVLGLLPRQARVTGGHIFLNRRPMLDLPARQRRKLLGDRLAYIPQDAMGSLNPMLSIGDQVGEALVVHRGFSWPAARRSAVELLRSVHLQEPERRVRDYPHQFSGGMNQRAMIAMGLALEPELIIADEPTTALDVTVQAQVLDLLREVRARHGTSILFITHDLALVEDFCDRVYVMYAGRMIEEGPVSGIFESPRHPYTAALLAATPSAAVKPAHLQSIPGQIPGTDEPIAGCVFMPRCSRAQSACLEAPVEREVGPGHRVRCWFPEGSA